MTVHFSEGESRVIDALRESPGTTIAALVTGTGVSRPTVRSALIKANARGNLITDQQWPRRYTYVEVAQNEDAPSGYAVAPDSVKPSEIGRVWKAGKPRIVSVIEGVDLTQMDKAKATAALEQAARAILGVYVALSRIEDGPEWRKEAGVK